MTELRTYPEMEDWCKERKRIGFIGSSETSSLQSDVFIIELYRRNDRGYSISITLDSDESRFVCDFESI